MSFNNSYIFCCCTLISRCDSLMDEMRLIEERRAAMNLILQSAQGTQENFPFQHSPTSSNGQQQNFHGLNNHQHHFGSQSVNNIPLGFPMFSTPQVQTNMSGNTPAMMFQSTVVSTTIGPIRTETKARS